MFALAPAYIALFSTLGAGALTAIVSGAFSVWNNAKAKKIEQPFREGDQRLQALTETVEALLPSIKQLREELDATQIRLNDCVSRDEVKAKQIQQCHDRIEEQEEHVVALTEEVSKLRKRVNDG